MNFNLGVGDKRASATAAQRVRVQRPQILRRKLSVSEIFKLSVEDGFGSRRSVWDGFSRRFPNYLADASEFITPSRVASSTHFLTLMYYPAIHHAGAALVPF